MFSALTGVSKARWPSGPRRHVKVFKPLTKIRGLVQGREFESHPCHDAFVFLLSWPEHRLHTLFTHIIVFGQVISINGRRVRQDIHSVNVVASFVRPRGQELLSSKQAAFEQ
mgnify:CR=1 FL=1